MMTRFFLPWMVFLGVTSLISTGIAVLGGRFIPETDIIAFLSLSDPYAQPAQAVYNIYLYAPRHGAIANLTPNDSGIPSGWTTFAWSPDGRRFAYYFRGAQGGSIYVYDIETRETHTLLTGYPFLRRLAWSPSGNHLALQGDLSAYLFNVADNSIIALRPMLSNNLIDDVEWIGDDNILALILIQSESRHLYLFDLSTGELTLLNDELQTTVSMSWSPDGSQLVTTGTSGNIYRLTLYDFNNNALSEPRILTTSQTITTGAPLWSLDGQQLVFLTYGVRNNERGIAFLNVSDGHLHQLGIHSFGICCSVWQR